MSDFQLDQAQRRRLLEGNMAPLEFVEKPWVEGQGRGIEPGDRYVLSWKRGSVTVLDTDTGECAVTPRHPVWFLTVTKVGRRRRGSVLVWEVRFEVTDRRDPDLWLSHSGDYQFTRRGAVDDLPVAPSDEVRRKAIAERDHLARLQRHAEKLKAQGRERSKARRKRAA